MYGKLAEEYGYDDHDPTIWMLDITERVKDGEPISITEFIRQQVIYLRKGDSANDQRRKKGPFDD